MANLDELAERLWALESKDEIRRLMAAYIQARDFKDGTVADYFTPDAVWEGIGRLASVLGRYEGRTAIAERFAGPVPPGLHVIANEAIEVHGDVAVGRWTYLQPMVLDGRALWVAARHHNDLHFHDGAWRFSHVRVEGIFEVPYEQGWADSPFFREVSRNGAAGA